MPGFLPYIPVRHTCLHIDHTSLTAAKGASNVFLHCDLQSADHHSHHTFFCSRRRLQLYAIKSWYLTMTCLVRAHQGSAWLLTSRQFYVAWFSLNKNYLMHEPGRLEQPENRSSCRLVSSTRLFLSYPIFLRPLPDQISLLSSFVKLFRQSI